MSSNRWNRAVASLRRLLGLCLLGKEEHIQATQAATRPALNSAEGNNQPSKSSGFGRKQGSIANPSLSQNEGPSSSSSAAHLSVGEAGETLAGCFLVRSKYRLMEKNLRVGGGEIDLIMLDGEEVVFVEVKSWISQRDEDPAEAVNHRKQRLLTRAALVYLKQHGWLERAARFDVMAIRFDRFPDPQSLSKMLRQMERSGNADGVSVRHYRSAFEAQGDSFFG